MEALCASTNMLDAHRGVEPQAALVGADRGAELHPVATVDLKQLGTAQSKSCAVCQG